MRSLSVVRSSAMTIAKTRRKALDGCCSFHQSIWQTSTLPGIPTSTFTYDTNDRIHSTENYDNNGNTTMSGARIFAYEPRP
jgi:hypothetical protein